METENRNWKRSNLHLHVYTRVKPLLSLHLSKTTSLQRPSLYKDHIVIRSQRCQKAYLMTYNDHLFTKTECNNEFVQLHIFIMIPTRYCNQVYSRTFTIMCKICTPQKINGVSPLYDPMVRSILSSIFWSDQTICTINQLISL